MLILLIGALGMLAASCNDDGGNLSPVQRDNGLAVKSDPCPMDGVDFEAEWTAFSGLLVGYYVEATFKVTPGEFFVGSVLAPGYPPRNRARIGLRVPAGALSGVSASEVDITVVIPAYDPSYTNDANVNLRIYSNLDSDVDLSQNIVVTVPRFPWYDNGEVLRIYYLTESGDAPPVYGYENLHCVLLTPAVTAINFNLESLPSIADRPEGGNAGWATNTGGGSN
jgi:hypothetical protein